MTKKKELLLEDYQKAVNNLKEAVHTAQDNLGIDGTIKRFELCYELAWKLIKVYLETKGLICKNPRDCFKAAKENGLIADEIKWLKIIEDRNSLVHTYTFEQSRAIFDEIKNAHYNCFNELLKEVVKTP